MPANMENSAVATVLEKVSFHSQRKTMPKNIQTTTQLHSYHIASKVLLKILQSRLQQYVKWELQIYKLDLKKAEKPEIKPEIKIVNICWIIEKAREFQKKTYFCFINYVKAFDCVDHNKLRKILKEMRVPGHLT